MVERDKVKRAYSGKPGCCCGCRGKYYNSGASSTDDAQVTKIVNLINENIDKVKVFSDSDNGIVEGYAFLNTGTRWYIAYFKEDTK